MAIKQNELDSHDSHLVLCCDALVKVVVMVRFLRQQW